MPSADALLQRMTAMCLPVIEVFVPAYQSFTAFRPLWALAVDGEVRKSAVFVTG